MLWSRKAGRDARGRRRPRLEALERRDLLTTIPAGSVNFDQIIGASAARAQYKVDGTGQSIAFIDTGVSNT